MGLSAQARATATTGLCLVGAALCIAGFHDVGQRYADYRFQYGIGVQEIPGVELAFYVWYALFGLPAAGLLAIALFRSELPDAALRGFAWARARPRAVLAGGAALLLAAILGIQTAVLQGSPVADDEATYSFVAQTLLEGRVTNPPPPEPELFRNQFVILNQHGWYGKYPIGHPLLLAAGEAVGLRALVVPLVACLCLLLAWAVGRRIFSPGVALLGALLLVASPQFVFTGATQLSQPTASLCLLLGLLALLRLEDEGDLRWALASGAAFGFGVLVRPLPGLLFLPVVAAYLAFGRGGVPTARRLRELALGALPIAACLGLFFLVNRAQTGHALESGYHQYHGVVSVLDGGSGALAASFGGALLRQSFWLFGWPLSLLFLPFAHLSRRSALLWALVAAAYAYRFVAPKTVVGTTGPIYVTEIVPLLALASASGMACVAERLRGLGLARPRQAVASVALALCAVAALGFLPVQLREVQRSGGAYQVPYRLLERADAERALVFADTMVDIAQTNSWAYYPPNPSPDLSDDILFARIPRGPEAVLRAFELWQRQLGERRAFVFAYLEGRPALWEVKTPNDLMRPPPDTLAALPASDAQRRAQRGTAERSSPK